MTRKREPPAPPDAADVDAGERSRSPLDVLEDALYANPATLVAQLDTGAIFEDPRERGREQEGSLRLIGNRWVYRWRDPPDENGRRRRRARTIGTLKRFGTRARAWREAKRLQPFLLKIAAGASPTFAYVCALYRHEALPLLADNTQATYATTIDLHLLPVFGELQVHEITTRRIRAWMRGSMRAHIEGKRRAMHATRKRERDVLLALLSFAAGENFHVEPIDLEELRLPRTRDTSTTVADRAYTKAERVAIAGACPDAADPHGAFYAVLDGAGLRGSEALALAWSLVAAELVADVAEPALKVRANVSRKGVIGPPKSRAGVRDVPIGAELVARLRAYHLACGRPSAGFLFPGETAAKPIAHSTVEKRFARLLRTLGIKRVRRGLHGFRHSVALAHADSGMAPAMICKLMGWSDLSSAKPYLRGSHLSPHEAVTRSLDARDHAGQKTESNGVRYFPESEMHRAPAKKSPMPAGRGSVVNLPRRPRRK